MSTKIYNAYKFSGDLLSLLAVLKDMKKWYEDKMEERVLSIFKKPVEEKNYSVVFDLCNRIANREYKILVNPEDCVMVYPHSSGLYIQFFCSNVIQELIDALPSLSDFHYQNQVDMPDEVTKKEWKHRSKVWEEIMTNYSAVENGFIFNLLEPYFYGRLAMAIVDAGRKDVKNEEQDQK